MAPHRISKEVKEKSREDLILAIKLAKSHGHNVGAVFYEVAAELKLLHYRLFGAMLAGGFVVVGPVLIRLLDIACVYFKLGIRMDYWTFDVICLLLGVPSMLAFAYKLRMPVKPRISESLIPAIDDITHRLISLESNEDGSDGSV